MRPRLATWLAIVLALLLGAERVASAAPALRVGSKRFVESYILAEIVTQLAKAEGATAEHALGLGGTAVVFRAIEDGAIDVYPEYTGTLAEAVVKNGAADLPALRAALAGRGLALSEPLGFENTYALAVTKALATKLGLSKVSDLAGHPELRVALSHEFVGRRDGWPGLAERYGLHPTTLSAIDHALAYEAIHGGDADVVDVYTTDAKIARFDLVVLGDDRHFFPPYDAVLVYRADLPKRVPAFERVLQRIQRSIDAAAMQRMNARAELDNVPFARVASDSLGASVSTAGSAQRPGLLGGTLEVIAQHGPRHVMLVAVSLALSTLLGVPLGILAYSRRRLGAVVLGVAGWCRPSRRSRSSASSSRCSGSGRSPRSPRCSSTDSCRSCATRTPASRRSPPTCARQRWRSASHRRSASGTSSCRSLHAPSSPASRRAPSWAWAAPPSQRSSAPAASVSRSAPASR